MTLPLSYTSRFAYADRMLVKGSEGDLFLSHLNQKTVEILARSEKTYDKENIVIRGLKGMAGVAGTISLAVSGLLFYVHLDPGRGGLSEKEAENFRTVSAWSCGIGTALLYLAIPRSKISTSFNKEASYGELLGKRSVRIQEVVNALSRQDSSLYSAEITRLERVKSHLQGELNAVHYWTNGGKGKNPGFQEPPPRYKQVGDMEILDPFDDERIVWAMRYIEEPSFEMGSDSE